MLVLHQAIKIEDGEYIKGYVHRMDGTYYINAVDKPGIGIPVRGETIEPIELVVYPQRSNEKRFKIPFLNVTISKQF